MKHCMLWNDLKGDQAGIHVFVIAKVCIGKFEKVDRHNVASCTKTTCIDCKQGHCRSTKH